MIKLVNNGKIPQFSTKKSAGADCYSNIDTIIEAGKYKLIPLGFCLQLPDGYEGQIRPRSGLALKNGITILNGPGTIDSDYTGEVGAIIINHSDIDFRVPKGFRICQLVISKYNSVTFKIDDISKTYRGNGGFGSTGVY